LPSADNIAARNDAFTFTNGKKQGIYEQNTLKALDLPGVNDRNQMPKSETRAKCEREADTGAIQKYCNLPRSQTNRLIVLKYFEDLLKKENPERSYELLDRNFIENHDSSTFR
jgi:hypothetical protein